jgi:2-polyprenyl-3-methyl-5-hydroxy-6-metoxy-1,4-benzoquinol methylase
MLQVAQRRFGHLHQVTFMHMDIMDVDDALGAFDLVICTYALSHIPEPWRAVDVGLARLRPEGKAIFAFIGEPGPSFRKVFKPVEALLTFRPVPREAPVDLGGATELARYDGVTMTAVLFAASSSGAEGG